MHTDSKRKILLVGLILGLFFASLDQTVVGTALPRIIGELGGLDILVWVTTAYMLSSTTVVPIAGKLADLYGRRILYVAGLVIFMIGSALCGQSQNMTELIIFRGIQGIGGGVMMPMAMTIVGDIFPPEKRGKWQGLMGAIFGLSSIVGPTIGGWIVDNSNWRWVFYINLPFGILAALTIFVGLHGEERRKDKAVIDYFGVITFVIGIVSLLLALSLGGKDYPWSSWQIAALFTVAFVFLVIFGFVEGKSEEPILSLHLFENRVFSVTNIIGFLMGLGMFGSIMFIPLFLQGVVGISATNSGNTLIPMMIAMMATSIVGGQFIAKFRFRTMLIAGMVVMSIAFYLLSTLSTASTQATAILYIIILGIGMGLIMPTVTIAVQSAFPAEQRGVATSATQFFRSIGATLGVTVLGAVMNHRSIETLNKDFFPKVESIPGLTRGPLGAMLSKAHEDPQSLYNLLLSPEALSKIPPQIQQIMLPPLRASLADALHVVFLVSMFVVLPGILISLFMGNARIEKKPSRPIAEEAGMELLTEEPVINNLVPPEIEPDIVEDKTDRK